MKRLEISRLMDEYEDNEFFPEGGTSADVQAVKGRVLAQVGMAKKRRTPPLKAVLLAAALAAASVLCIAAAVGGPVVRYLSGGTYANRAFDFDGSDLVSPVMVEDGRIWFIADGQHLDITDLIDAETPYIYTHTDPETLSTSYTVVGGSLDDLGWFEYALWEDDGDTAFAGTVGENYYTNYLTIHGETYSYDETPEELWDELMEAGLIPEPGDGESDYYAWREDRPWVIAAHEALAGIDRFH